MKKIGIDKNFIERQKEKLLKKKLSLLNKVHAGDDLTQSPDEVIEEGDQAQIYFNQNISFGIREKDIAVIRDIDLALEKIEKNQYGVCEVFDRPIEVKRLEKIPWARLCIEAAEEQEREHTGEFKIAS